MSRAIAAMRRRAPPHRVVGGIASRAAAAAGDDDDDDDVERVLRRINRRVAIAVRAFDGSTPVPATNARARRGSPSTAAMESSSSSSMSPTSLFVWLHGFADDGGAAWAEFARAVVARDADDEATTTISTLILTPDAPLVRAPRAFNAHEGARDDLEVRAWFEPRLRSAPGRRADSWTCDGVDASMDRVREIVDDACAKHAIARDRVVLGGFSQGACLALACAAREMRDIGGVLAVRGYLPNRIERRVDDEDALARRPDALILAGGADPLVPVEWSLEAGEFMRARVVLNEDVGHELCADDIYRARRWLARRFASRPAVQK